MRIFRDPRLSEQIPRCSNYVPSAKAWSYSFYEYQSVWNPNYCRVLLAFFSMIDTFPVRKKIVALEWGHETNLSALFQKRSWSYRNGLKLTILTGVFSRHFTFSNKPTILVAFRFFCKMTLTLNWSILSRLVRCVGVASPNLPGVCNVQNSRDTPYFFEKIENYILLYKAHA